MTSERDDILAVDSARYAAMISGDVGEIARFLDGDLVYSHSDGSRDGYESYLDKVSQRHFVYESVSAPAETVLVFGDCAVIAGRMTAEVRVGGQRRRLDNGCLAVYRKRGEAWKLVAYQPTPLPRD